MLLKDWFGNLSRYNPHFDDAKLDRYYERNMKKEISIKDTMRAGAHL